MKQLKQQITKLDSTALKELRTFVDSRLALLSSAAVLDDDFSIFYNCVIDRFSNNGGNYPPFKVLSKTSPKIANKLKSAFNDYSEWLQVNIITAFDVPFKRVNRVQAYNVFIDVIYDVMKNIYDIPVSLNSFANLSTKFPEFFDQAFPNYLEAGIASLVFGSSIGQFISQESFRNHLDEIRRSKFNDGELFRQTLNEFKNNPYRRRRFSSLEDE